MRVLTAILFAASVLSGADAYAEGGAADAAAASGQGENQALMQGAMLGSAAQKAKESGSGSSKALEMMMLAQMMQAQQDKDKKKENEDADKKSKEGDEDSKNKTVKWDLPKAVETKFEIPQVSDDDYRKQRAQSTNSELETVRAGNDSPGLRSNEFVKLDTDPFILALGQNNAATGGGNTGNGAPVARPDSNPYDKAPIEDIRGAAPGKTAKSELVPIAGDLGGGMSNLMPIPQNAPNVNPFAPGSATPLVTGGSPLGSTSGGGSSELGGDSDGHGDNASGGVGSGGAGGGGSGGGRGVASLDGGGSRAGTLPIGSDSGGGASGSSLNFGNFKSAEGTSLDGSPLYEGSSMPIARKESDINLFEYASYRLKKIAFTEKRVRTTKETLRVLPPKQAALAH